METELAVIFETAKAWKFRDLEGAETWIPKSFDEVKVEAGRATVPLEWAQKHGLMIGDWEPVKSLMDAVLWLRRYQIGSLDDFLDRHDKRLKTWIWRKRPPGHPWGR